MTEETVTHPRPILALVTDLFFTLKIGDIAKAVGLPIHFAGSAEEFLDRFRTVHPALVIADLTSRSPRSPGRSCGRCSRSLRPRRTN